MRILAISYFLPPMLYPQAIQIGRLLAYASAEIAVVSGRGDEHGQALDCYRDLDRKFSFHVDVPHRSRLRGRIFHMAQRFAPFYARVPDEYRGWVSKAERSLWSRIEEAEFRPDVLVTFGEPMSDHILGLQIHRRLGVPWVAHFSDPWVDNPFRQSNLLSNFEIGRAHV